MCWNVGPRSHNVFEHLLLIRFIHDVGRESLFLDFHDIISNVINLTNPVNRASAPRINAMSLIVELSPERLSILRALRQQSGEPMNIPDLLITDAQMQHMSETLAFIDRRVLVPVYVTNGVVLVDCNSDVASGRGGCHCQDGPNRDGFDGQVRT